MQQCATALQAAPAARVQARRQQVVCAAAPMQQRAVGVVAPKVGRPSSRNVAAHAKGAIKPMEATFTDFELIDKNTKTDWTALIASADFFFNDAQNESMAENLREKVRYMAEKGKKVDMLFACEPAWLEQMFPAEAAKCKRPAVALLSPDKTWITFMRIRLDRVIEVSLPNMTAEEVATSTAEVPRFKIDEDNPWTAPYVPYAWGWWERFMIKK